MGEGWPKYCRVYGFRDCIQCFRIQASIFHTVSGRISIRAGLHYTYPRDKRRAHFLAQMEPLNPEVSLHNLLVLSLCLHQDSIHALYWTDGVSHVLVEFR